MSRIRILLVSRSSIVAAEIEELLAGNPAYRLTTKIVSNGHVDPLHDVTASPDLLLLHCDRSFGELEHLAEAGSASRPPIIVIGPANDPDAMRLAMRAGASDYLTTPVSSDELSTALQGVASQCERVREESGQLVTVVNSRGGSGGSFLAANLAYGLQTADELKSLLIDFDLQFGGLVRFFDLNPKRGIIEALAAANDMDEVAAETYITKHKSGLRVLAACTDSLSLSNVVLVERIEMLLQVFLRHNEFVVADLPRRIDPVGASVLENSQHILLVVQQSLSHLNDAMMLMRLFTEEIGVESERITVVLNRYDKNSLIDAEVIEKTLKTSRIANIPNNYALVAESTEAGKPLLSSAKHSAVAKAVLDLQRVIRGVEPEQAGQGILGRAIPALLRRAK